MTAVILLVLPLTLVPINVLDLFQNVMLFRSGEIQSAYYSSFFAFLTLFAVYFAVYSGLIYGHRNIDNNDELRQHFRANAIRSGYWAMLASGAILFAASIASPFWASMALPLTLLAGVVAPLVRFALLELFTGRG